MKNKCSSILAGVAVLAPFSLDTKEIASARTGVRCLKRDEAIRLERQDKFKKLEVARGLVWLTGTPAKGDVLLRPGQSFDFQNHWPYVVQALEAAEFSLA